MKRDRAEVDETVVARATAGERATARSLRELGLPDELASSLEEAFRAVGATSGDRVIGFTFVTPDGERHAIRQESIRAGLPLGRAA